MPTRSPIAGTGYEKCDFGDALQDCFACGVLTLDAEGGIASLTPRAARLLGLSGARKQNPSEADLPSPIQSIIREARSTGKTVADQKVALNSSEGSAAGLSVTAMPLSPVKAAGSVVVVLRDLSSMDNLEQDMRRLDRLASIGTLAASMAHEIKNALVPVKTFVDLLLEKYPDTELAGTVQREMGRADAIVSRMLKFAAPAKPLFLSVRLHEILDHSLRLVQHRIEGKLISFKREFNASSDFFTGDDHQLEQAFVNLLLNAIDAMGSEGTLTVATELTADDALLQLREGEAPATFLRLTISDTGVGIAPENLGSIFEPFFTTKQSGTGLGLAVTRSIIEEHHGVIRVESQPGKGTTFIILLPAGSEDGLR